MYTDNIMVVPMFGNTELCYLTVYLSTCKSDPLLFFHSLLVLMVALFTVLKNDRKFTVSNCLGPSVLFMIQFSISGNSQVCDFHIRSGVTESRILA